jgi:hypothetical protein
VNLKIRLNRLERHHLASADAFRPLTDDEAALLPTDLLERIVTLARKIQTEGRVSDEDRVRDDALRMEVRAYLARHRLRSKCRPCVA